MAFVTSGSVAAAAAATTTTTGTAILTWEIRVFLGAVSADAPASMLSFAFYTTPRLFGHAEALMAASLVTGTRVGTS